MRRHVQMLLLLCATSAGAAELAEPRAEGSLLPDAPTIPCVVDADLRQPSISQLEKGDEATVSGDHIAARGHYRAALTVDVCNAFAWASLGSSLMATDARKDAATAYLHATTLVPTHFLFWAKYGEALEQLGQLDEARAAFQEALFLNADHAPAERGFRRTLRAR